ncbi:hypothetical protein [Actinokineospora diospyrosa]|uniref:Uncharacterized protein n=1 Tax=Actinokineospora diospyrosa TaxID=103728 RepID=A0ABT1IH70_9PSEU|nr:hypothetical protein [Actinokineospora diospyrosa]MCP2271993.1 hypothetical protein [Actinokineospora diospyrosa]
MALAKFAPVVGAAALVLSGLGAGSAAAQAPSLLCFSIVAQNQTVQLQQFCGTIGTYHFAVYGGTSSGPRPAHTYTGSPHSVTFPFTAAVGSNVCAELWYHKPAGGYESKGNVCDPM